MHWGTGSLNHMSLQLWCKHYNVLIGCSRVDRYKKQKKKQLTLKSPVVTICTASLTLTNYAFGPHSLFMCIVWI